MEIEVNYLAVVLAAVATMILGFLWYSPYLLGKPWMKERGYTSESLKKEQSAMGKLYGLSFLVALITAYVLTHMMTLSMNYFGEEPIMTGLTTGFWTWLGFMMPVQVTATIFSDKKNWKLFGIDTGYQLASLLIMGVVIGSMMPM